MGWREQQIEKFSSLVVLGSWVFNPVDPLFERRCHVRILQNLQPRAISHEP
jgi:hypothetical protein